MISERHSDQPRETNPVEYIMKSKSVKTATTSPAASTRKHRKAREVSGARTETVQERIERARKIMGVSS
jgi:hypothetical protein